MKQLLKYEWKKLFKHRSILLLLAAFTILNIWKIHDTWKSTAWFADAPGWGNAYWEMYPEFNGELTSDKYSTLMDIYQPLADKVREMTFNRAIDPNSLTGINEFSDYLMLSRYYVLPYERYLGYSSNASSITEIARENVRLFSELGNSYEVNANVRTYGLFSGREIKEFAYTEMYARITHYDFSIYLVLLLCLYAISTSFLREQESEMDMLLLTTPNGGRRTIAAKLIVLSAFTAATTLWFSMVDWVGFAISYGTSAGSTMPIFALANFAQSPLSMSLWKYFLVSSVTKVIGIWVLCSIYTIFVSKAKSFLLPFITGCFAALLLVAAATNYADTSNIWLKAINPASLLLNHTLYGRTEFIQVADFPFLSYEMAFICSALLLTTTLLITTLSANRNLVYMKKHTRVLTVPKEI